MRQHHPKGNVLPALEKNILKYRAFDMIIVLFYVERVKRIIGNIALKKSKPSIKELWRSLVEKGIITPSESEEVQELIDYRNDIGHNVHTLVYDLSRDKIAVDYADFYKGRYNYKARKRIKVLYKKISDGMRRYYSSVISYDEILFEAADKTYEQELKKLDKKIVRQIEDRIRENKSLNAQALLDEEAAEDAHHFNNVFDNGKLTKRGKEACYRLFNLGKSPLIVAYIMRISYRSACGHFRRWKESTRSAKKSQRS